MSLNMHSYRSRISIFLVAVFCSVLLMSGLSSAQQAIVSSSDAATVNYDGVNYEDSGFTDTNGNTIFAPSSFQCGAQFILVNQGSQSYTLVNTSSPSGATAISDCVITEGNETILSAVTITSEGDCDTVSGVWVGGVCRFVAGTNGATFLAANAGATEDESCENNGGDFGFILCPLLRQVTNAFEELDSRVRRALEVKPQYYENDSLQQAWGRIRNVGYLVLIPILLVMVISTALGFSFVDAYTVKRAMPRLFIAIIFMSISYDFCRILIDVTNGVGRSVAGLIAAPFDGTEALTLERIFNPTLTNGVSGGGLGAGATIVLFGVGALSLGILVSYMFTAALALLIIFVILTLRELIIVFLIILSPLAIISWIFPGNDKLWKLWWGTFSKLLFLYPLIVALLVTGRAFARISGDIGAEGIEGVFMILVKLTAYIGPFFIIPKAFQYAGSAFGNVVGMVNDRGKGLFDSQRKYRGEARKKNRERIGGDKAFKNGNPDNFRGKLNTKFSNAYGFKDALKEGGIKKNLKGDSRRAGIAAMQARNVKQHKDHIMEDKDVAEWLGYDDLTGLSSAVASGDEKTLEGVLRNTYRFVGDTGGLKDDGTLDEAAESELKNGVAKVMDLKKKGDLRGALSLAYEMADHKNNVKEHYIPEAGGNYIAEQGADGINYRKAEAGETGTHSMIKGSQAFSGDSRFRAISLEQVTNAFRKYGDEPLVQAMTLKAMAGGTFYKNAGDTWDAVLSSVTHNGHVDRNALADMAVKGRQVLMATGRVEGAASFGATLGTLSDLENGNAIVRSADAKAAFKAGKSVFVKIGGQEVEVDSEEQFRQKISNNLINTAYEQKGSVIFTHPDMKTGYIRDNAIPVIQERIHNAYINAEKNNEYRDDVAEDGTVTRTITSEAYMAEIASAENLLKSLGSSKPEAIKLFANQIFSLNPKTKVVVTPEAQQAQQQAQLNYQVEYKKYEQQARSYSDAVQARDKIIEAINAGIKDTNGNDLVIPDVPPQPAKPQKPDAFISTVRADIGLYQSNPVYQNMGFQWQQAEMQWRQTIQQEQMQLQQQQFQQQLLMQQAQQGGGPIGGNGPGGMPPSGTPPGGRPLGS